MTILPMIKKCPVCHKEYSYNPSVGRFFCPYCHGIGKEKRNIVEKILDKIRNASKDESK